MLEPEDFPGGGNRKGLCVSVSYLPTPEFDTSSHGLDAEAREQDRMDTIGED